VDRPLSQRQTSTKRRPKGLDGLRELTARKPLPPGNLSKVAQVRKCLGLTGTEHPEGSTLDHIPAESDIRDLWQELHLDAPIPRTPGKRAVLTMYRCEEEPAGYPCAGHQLASPSGPRLGQLAIVLRVAFDACISVEDYSEPHP
jgi:hypothetical protein